MPTAFRHCFVVRLTLLALAGLGAVLSLAAGEPPDLLNQTMEKIVADFNAAKQKADIAYERQIEPAVKQRAGAIEQEAKRAITRLEKLKEEAKKGSNDLLVTSIENQIETLKTGAADSKPRIPLSKLDPLLLSYKGHHYMAFPQKAVSWTEAQKICENMGGHLACLEEKELVLLLKDRQHTDNYWIGMRGKGAVGWKWLSGRSVDKALWEPGWPLADQNRVCGFVNSWGTFGNIFEKDTAIRGFVCEWDW